MTVVNNLNNDKLKNYVLMYVCYSIIDAYTTLMRLARGCEACKEQLVKNVALEYSLFISF